MFNPHRLALARKRRGLTKKEFAEAIGVQPRSATGFEAGEIRPAPETIERISKVLGFPVAFFERDDVDEPNEMSASFRSLTKMSARHKHSALAAGSLAFELSDWIEQKFDLPTVDVLDLRDQTPEVAATILRQHWGLGEQSVRNMVHLLEAKGVRVFSLAENADDVDAFSLWRDRKPYVFLNTMKSAERSRFDAAHELGHLVLHKHGAPSGLRAEQEANQFASAFLMPRASVSAHMPRYVTLGNLISLKSKWIVSVAALAYRFHALEALTDWQYRSICMQMSERGYFKSEPIGAPRETSLVWEKIFNALRNEEISKEHIAFSLSIPADEIEKLVWGLVTMALSTPEGPVWTSKRRANLRIIK